MGRMRGKDGMRGKVGMRGRDGYLIWRMGGIIRYGCNKKENGWMRGRNEIKNGRVRMIGKDEGKT